MAATYTPEREREGVSSPTANIAMANRTDKCNDASPPAENDPTGNVTDYPEGGTTAWLVVLGAWLANFAGLGISNSMATIQAYISAHQLADYDEGQIGWIFSMFVFLCFFCGIYIGPMFDKYGPRWLIFTGSICIVAALMLLSFCTKYWHFFLTFGVLNGTGASLLFTPSYSAVGHWFQERRGLATGVASTGASFAGMVYPVLLRFLFDRVGWAWSIRTIGFVCLAFCAAATFLVKSRLAPAENATTRPDPRIFRDPAFSLTTAAVFFLEFGIFIPLTYISSFSLRQGFGTSFSYQIPTILNSASVVGRVLAGWWGDRFGPFNSNMLAALLNVVACLAVWLPAGSSVPGVVMFCVIFGFGSGNNISISPVCIGRLCETKNYGRYYATAFTVAAVACLVGVPVGGEIVAASGGSYQGLIVFSGLLFACCFVALVAAKVVRVGWKLKSRY